MKAEISDGLGIPNAQQIKENEYKFQNNTGPSKYFNMLQMDLFFKSTKMKAQLSEKSRVRNVH